MLNIQPGTDFAVWNTVVGEANTLASEGSSGAGTYAVGQTPDNLFDGSLGTKFSSRGNSSSGTNALAGLNTGFFVTVAQCQPVLIGFRFGNAYNNSEREPIGVTVEGTNCGVVATCTNWSTLYTGSSGLDIQENFADYGEYQSFSNAIVYTSYRFLVTSKRNISTYVSYSEVQLFGYSNQTSSSQTGSGSKFEIFSLRYLNGFVMNSFLDSTSLFVVQSGSAQPLWNTYALGASTIASSNTSGVGTYYTGQGPDNLFDGNFNTKFTSRGNSSSGMNAIAGLNTGFYVTIAQCQPTLVTFRFATASNGSSVNRDPTDITVEGTNCNDMKTCITWTLIYNGTTGIENVSSRSTFGDNKTITSPSIYTSYRFLVTAKKGISDYVAYSEVELYGN